MRQLPYETLIPPGFIVDQAGRDGAELRITVRHQARSGRCPGCGAQSGRVHSRYQRCLADLPMAGRPVRLLLLARRFRCGLVCCGRRSFTERFDPDVLAPWARRTTRLEAVVHPLAIALGGRPAARLARRLVLPVGKDTLLRVVRRRGSPNPIPPTVIGIDDWAWRRNRRYGTIISDLERRRTIALLPDRGPATVQAWLSSQRQVAVVARDRGGSYALAAAKALPHATQVADRWHLMENASRAFLDAVRTSMRQIRGVLGATTVDPPVAHRRRADPARGLPAPRGDQPGHPRLGQGRCHDQGDRAPYRSPSRPRPEGPARPTLRRFPGPGAFAGGPPALARGAVDGRAAQRRRTVASAAAAWLPRLAARGHGMGDPAPESGEN